MKIDLGFLLFLATYVDARSLSLHDRPFTSDINWSKITGSWFLSLSTHYIHWVTLYKCHIISPFNITEDGMQIYTLGIPKDSATSGNTLIIEVAKFDSREISDVAINAGGVMEREETKLEWEEHHDDARSKIVKDINWFGEHEVLAFTNYEVLFFEQPYFNGRMAIWMYTRNSVLSKDEINYLIDLAVKNGATRGDLIPSQCNEVKPNEYWRT